MSSAEMTLGTVASRRLSLVEMTAEANLVEGLGYECLWIPEVAERDAIVTATALTAGTDSIRLATGIVPLPLRSPTLLPMAAAAAAEASDGRFVLGVGLGHEETVGRWYGAGGPSRLAMAEERLLVLRQVLETGEVNHSGEHFDVDFRLRARHYDAAPEVVLAALSPKVTHLATKLADGILCNWVPPSRVEILAAGVAEGCSEHERDPDRFTIACYVPVCVTDDPEAARESLAKQLRAYSRLRSYRRVLEECGLGDDIADLQATGVISERCANELAAIGTPSDVRSKLAEFSAAGVDHAVLVPIPIGEAPWESMVTTWSALAPHESG